MPRLPVLKREEMDAEQARVYDGVVKTTGRAGGGPSIAYAYAPGLWEAVNHVSAYFDHHSSLSPQQVRMIALVTVRHWNSAFPWAAQARFALQAGVPSEVVEAINAKQTPKLASKEDETLYGIAKEVLASGTLSDATFKAAQAMLGNRKLVDAVGLTAQFTKTAFMANLGGAEAPADAPSKLK
jgi:4-carboxymuconolactone decarboxylase